MEKKIGVLCGSNRRGGNSEQLADAFIKGAKSVGHQVKKITLYNKNIVACTDCKHCYKENGVCILKDAMEEIYQIMMEIEVLVIASPVYFYNFPAKLKAVFDRLHNPIRDKFKIKETYLLTAYADQGETVCKPMIDTYLAINGYLGWSNEGILVVDGVEDKDSIVGNKALLQAEEMGRQIR